MKILNYHQNKDQFLLVQQTLKFNIVSMVQHGKMSLVEMYQLIPPGLLELYQILAFQLH